MRWARELMASGRARPEEIAIAAASPTDYNDHLTTLAADANLDLHFVHGRKAVATRDGQACAALAEVLLRGLSHDRVQRLFALLRSQAPELEELPADWVRVLPEDAPLLSFERWQQLFTRLEAADWPDGIDRAPLILSILELLARGSAAAEEAGERLLLRTARAVWTKALQEGPSAALDVTLADLRIADDIEPASSIAWMPAAALAASPRRFASLLGLSSRAWPRGITEDALLPDHVVPLGELDPLPVAEAEVLSVNALTFEQPSLDAQQSWAEVAFGDARAGSGGLPWDPSQPIEVPGTGLSISGKIDRLDLSADRCQARVTDYKTGRVPKDIGQMVLKGGKELQRCLYGYAVMTNLGEGVAVEAALVYPRDGGGVFPLADAEQVLQQLAHYLALARGNMLAGLALPGEDAKSEYNEFAFALPGNAKAVYCEKKLPLARDRLGEAVRVWNLP